MKTGPLLSTSTSREVRSEDHRPALAGQYIAGFGAALALLGPFSEVVAGIGVATLILGVVLSAPIGQFPGPHLAEWWSPLAVATLAVLAGFGLAFWLAAPGGILLTAGAVVALAAVFLGTPARPE